MESIRIEGGHVLTGETWISGAKNAALPLLFASLLAEGEHVFTNVPRLQDVFFTQKLLEHFGCKTEFKKNQFSIQVPQELSSVEAPYDVVRKMRASVLCLGPLLARAHRVRASLPGGCAIGTRPINFHIEAFKQLGAKAKLEKGFVDLCVSKDKALEGARVLFEGVTVGGTENLLMLSVLAKGETIIENAAKEPEVVDLVQCLKSMGARIEGEGSSVIRVQGVQRLRPSRHHVVPDRIEAGTLLMAAAITGGSVRLTHLVPTHLGALLDKMREAGFVLSCGKDWVQLDAASNYKGVDVTTAPYPGFATDLQAQFMALMTQAEGSSVITEGVFENRFMHVQELVRLGADILPKNQVAVVRGKTPLQGAQVMATDLRASACLIVAALAAKGQTHLGRVYHLDRGYECLEQKLRSLGGKVFREAR